MTEVELVALRRVAPRLAAQLGICHVSPPARSARAELSQRDNCHQRAASVPLASYGQVPENRQQDAGGTLLSQRDNGAMEGRASPHLTY
jgi:hypothetical protein